MAQSGSELKWHRFRGSGHLGTGPEILVNKKFKKFSENSAVTTAITRKRLN